MKKKGNKKEIPIKNTKTLFPEALDKHRNFILTYIFIVLIEIFVSPQYPDLKLLTKAAIVSSLLIYYILKVPPQNKLYILALIAALGGDLFLAVQRGSYFELGLSSFLIMQILYILIFKKGYSHPVGNKKLLSILIGAFYLVFVIFSWGRLGDLQIPVLIYALALLTMLYFALNINTGKTINYFAWGALAFVISDLLLALNKFVTPLPYEHFLVMATYGLAQFLICFGLILSYERYSATKAI